MKSVSSADLNPGLPQQFLQFRLPHVGGAQRLALPEVGQPAPPGGTTTRNSKIPRPPAESFRQILGPTRQSYRDVMNLVSRAGQELEEVLYV